jgi:hypothetical protein
MSVMVPGGLSGEKLYLDVNDTVTLEFTVRGDSASQNVEFFVRAGSQNVQVNGTFQYKVNVSLGVYEQRFFSVQIKGISSGTSAIQYGFKYLGGQGGFGFEQVVQNSIAVVVSGGSTNLVPIVTTTTTRSSSGGGSGSSTVYSVKTSNMSNTSQGLSSVVIPSVSRDVDESPRIDVETVQTGKSVNAFQESLSEGNKDTIVENNNVTVKVQGRTILLVIIGLLVLIVVVSGISMKMVGRADAL